LKQFEDFDKYQRLQLLRKDRTASDADHVYNWLQENQQLFEKPVLGPVCLEVSFKDQLHARYLEIVAPSWVAWVSFFFLFSFKIFIKP